MRIMATSLTGSLTSLQMSISSATGERSSAGTDPAKGLFFGRDRSRERLVFKGLRSEAAAPRQLCGGLGIIRLAKSACRASRLLTFFGVLRKLAGC